MTQRHQQKKQYRRLEARKMQLPPSQRAAMEAVERYAMRSGRVRSGEDVVAMMTALVDVFEQSVVDGIPLTAVVGEDPAAFAETFLSGSLATSWVQGEQERLAHALARAAGSDAGAVARIR